MFSRITLYLNHIDLMSPPTCTHFRVCFVQPKSTNTEIKKRMCTPSKTCVFTHHPLSKPYRFNAAPHLYALPSRLYTSRVDLNHLPSMKYQAPVATVMEKRSNMVRSVISEVLSAHLFLAIIGKQRWVMAKLPRLQSRSKVQAGLAAVDSKDFRFLIHHFNSFHASLKLASGQGVLIWVIKSYLFMGVSSILAKESCVRSGAAGGPV